MMKTLEPKYVARAEACAKLNRAEEAVLRAMRFESIAAEQLKSLELRTSQAEDAEASKLAALFASDTGLDSVHASGEVQTDLALALAAARHDHSIKAKALATLKAARTAAQKDLAQAERAVVQAVDQLLGDEIAERARKVDDLLNEAHRLGVALKHFAAAAGIHATTMVPAPTLSVLDRLNLPLINALQIPIDMAKLGDVAAFRDWTARREQLISGTPSEEPKAA